MGVRLLRSPRLAKSVYLSSAFLTALCSDEPLPNRELYLFSGDWRPADVAWDRRCARVLRTSKACIAWLIKPLTWRGLVCAQAVVSCGAGDDGHGQQKAVRSRETVGALGGAQHAEVWQLLAAQQKPAELLASRLRGFMGHNILMLEHRIPKKPVVKPDVSLLVSSSHKPTYDCHLSASLLTRPTTM
eukprot:364258-Chlamydomonas_euryale.AAC.10